MAKRTHAVWAAGVGWIQKKQTEDANYENLGKGWIFLIGFMRLFPDFIQDLLRSEEADYELTLIQRIIMRVQARYQYCDITGCRGLTKSFCTTNEALDELVLFPGIRTAYFGPSYKQTAKIGSQTYKQIQKDYPALTSHFVVDQDAVDRFELSTSFRSNFAITAFRGNNIHKVIAEETAQEENPQFDDEEYKGVVLPAVRLPYLIMGKKDPSYVSYKQHTITSAGRRQNHSYETRTRHYQMMMRGESAFVMDVPFEVSLLCQMRPVSWAESLKMELTPDKWAREMESRYTGTDQNPVISDADLTESRCLLAMEEHHCCKDADNRLEPNDVFYIIGYDVSYADGAANAKCACVVIKCTKQKEWRRRLHYLKQVVWVNDWAPKTASEQAANLKRIWSRFSYEGSYAYIAIDAWQYGSSVVEALMQNLNDGLDPLCTYNHTMYTEMELVDSLPVIYPIKAGGVGTTDPDAEMIRNAEMQFQNRNVELLTSNFGMGIDAYKKLHRIKDDKSDYAIYIPYKKTNEMIGQIQNLKKVPNINGVQEKRISRMIQRDSWSALKYSLRLAQILERQFLMRTKKESDWDKELNKFKNSAIGVTRGSGVGHIEGLKSRRITKRVGRIT